MTADTESIWNVTTESIRREYGFSYRTGYNRQFNRNCLGSHFLVQRMQFSHITKAHFARMYCMNFKHDRNLICVGTNCEHINVFDWKDDLLKYSFKTKHPGVLYDVKFLNTGGYGMDIISACTKGHVRHTCIAPAGNFVSRRIFINTNKKHRLITVPRKPLEFIAASSNGGIFQIDLRSERWSPQPDAIVSNENRFFFSIQDIAHHPFAPEICVSGGDAIVRVFDKRNLKEVLHKMYPNTFNIDSANIYRCAYNYDGSEILANYFNEGVYLFDNKCYKSGEFLHFYNKHFGPCSTDKVSFFGPKSEYLVRGANKDRIFFQDKNTEAFVTDELHNSVSNFCHTLEVHPHLPVIATSHSYDISIWAPTRLQLNNVE